MQPWHSRPLVALLLCLYCFLMAYGLSGRQLVYTPFLDTLYPTVRPVGSGTDRVLSLMFPVASYFGLAVSQSADTPEHRIVIDTQARTLTLYLSGEKLRTYPVAVGKARTPTPVGEWIIISKSLNWGGGFGTRWLGLNLPWGIYGIHGTNKPYAIGSAVSGGCIRMLNGHVEELFRIVSTGTPVDIVGPWREVRLTRTMRSGTVGRDVQMLQRALRATGLDPGRIDGRFGPQTEQAVREVETFFGFEVDGIADDDILFLLQLR